MEFPELHTNAPMRIRGRHIQQNAHIIVDGRRVEGNVTAENGTLPNATNDIVIVELAQLPESPGLHLLQIQNPDSLFSNDYPFFVLEKPHVAKSQNLISSGGTFDEKGGWNANLNNAAVTWEGEANFTIDAASDKPWHVQLTHKIAIKAGVEYVICYSAKAEDTRYITLGIDTGPGEYRSLIGTGVEPEVGRATADTGAGFLSTTYRHFTHRFVSTETDPDARIRFDMAQSDIDVQIDNVALYESSGCVHTNHTKE